MGNNIGNTFIHRPKLAIVISLVIILAGILSLKSLPLEEYPSITPPQVIVSATYSGASSDVVESTVAAPIESQLNGVENMIYMSSSSQNGSYKLTLFFDVDSDPNMNVINVQNELQLVTPRLPEEVKRYGLSVKKATGGAGLLLISITSPNNTYDNLFISNYSDIYIEDELARIKGVGQISVYGSSNYAMRIWLNADKMANYSLSVNDISNAIQEQNSQFPAGELGVEPIDGKNEIKLTMKTKGRLKDPKQFENIIIKSLENGAHIRLKDVARVELGAESYSHFSRISKKNATIISVNQLPEANAIDLSNKIKDRIKELSKKFPKDIIYKIQHDETEFVRESIKEVIWAVILSVILVSGVTYLFIGSLRASFIPFCAIPVSLLGVFTFIKLFGFSINLLILFGLVLSVGLVVDDAIVVLENTQRHISEGKTSELATGLTMKEVFGAVVATSLVLMAVFVPVSMSAGITGKMFKQFAICIAASIGISTIVAISLSPALCTIILKENKTSSNTTIKLFNSYFEKLKIIYVDIVKKIIFDPKFSLSFLIIAIISVICLFIIIPKGFLPQEDRGAIFTQLQLPDGSSASRTNIASKEIEEKILNIEGVEDTISMVGMNGENTAFIVSSLKPWSKRKNKKESAQSIINTINKNFSNYSNGILATFSPPAISGLGMFGGFEYQLLDKGERSTSKLYSEALKLISEGKQNSKFSTLYTSYSANLPQILLDIKAEKAKSQNVSIMEIYNALGTYFAPKYINDFNKYGRVYRVYVEGDSNYRTNLSDIDKIYVRSNNGKMVQLSTLLTIKNTVGPYARTRFNMYPSITINGNTNGNISSGEGIAEMEKLSDKVLPSDMTYEWSGTAYQEKRSSGKTVPIILMSLIFVYLFLVGLYESWFLPLAVLLVVPIAIFGALFCQYIFGLSLDIYSSVGLVMLIGLSSKQAILIVEFAKDAHKNGLSIENSALRASELRFRAVMMTNVSFLLGLLPLVFAGGAGAASRHSVGVTVFGGMMFVSAIGILFIPAYYVICENLKIFLSKKIRGLYEKNNL